MKPLHFATQLLLVTLITSSSHGESFPQLGQNPIVEVIAALTVEEKVSLVTGTGMKMPGLPPSFQPPVVGTPSRRERHWS